MADPLDPAEIVEFLRDLVRCPTVNPPGETKRCAQLLAERFDAAGIEAEVLEASPGQCNVVARLGGRKPGKTLLLNGHMDVVLPGEGWTADPFGGEIRDGKMYGRGTCDMKSGLVAMAAALVALKRSGTPFAGEVLFSAVADEETGSEQGTLYLTRRGIGTQADFAVVAEPTNLRVALGNRGLRWIDITVRGVAAHAGRPHLGVNAVHYGARLVQALHTLRFDRRHDLFEVPTASLSVTMAGGGSKINIIPERFELSVDRRMIPGETEQDVLDEIRTAVDEVRREDDRLRIDVRTRPAHWDPYILSETEPVAQAMRAAVEDVTGRRPEIQAKSGCTDASHLYHLAGIPTVIFGPGDETLAHKPDECVSVDRVVAGAKAFQHVVTRLLG